MLIVSYVIIIFIFIIKQLLLPNLTNRSTLIRLSFPTLDANKCEYYPLHAGHIASRL